MNAIDDPSTAGPVDVVVLTVKLYDLEEACAAIAPMVGPATMIVPIQNGVSAVEIVCSRFDRKRVVGGLVFIASYVVAPGEVVHKTQLHRLVFGELDGSPSERVLAFRDAGRAAGFDAEASDDIELAPWTTLALNARYEPDTKNSMLLDLEAGKPLEHEWISGEIARFGRELGVPTPFHETAHAAPEPFAAGNRPAR